MQRKRWMIAAAVILFMALPAQAQHIEFGAKVGLNTTKLTMNKELFSKKNQTGFFLGPTVKIGLPITGLGCLWYVLHPCTGPPTTLPTRIRRYPIPTARRSSSQPM